MTHMALSLPPRTVAFVGDKAAGKSELCNSIYGSTIFPASSSTSAVTRGLNRVSTIHCGRILTLIDTEGVPNIYEDDRDIVLNFLESVENFSFFTRDGINAFLLVYRFEAGFGEKEEETLKTLKKTFGRFVFRDYGILVITGDGSFRSSPDNSYGGSERGHAGAIVSTNEENSYLAAARLEDAFVTWCETQTGVFRELYNECEGRIVHFDNMVSDEQEMQTQINKLMATVDNLPAQHPYTAESFVQAEDSRMCMRIIATRPEITNRMKNEFARIRRRLEMSMEKIEIENRLESMGELDEKMEILMSEIEECDKGTKILQDLIDEAKLTQAAIHNAIVGSKYVASEFKGLRERTDSLENYLKEGIGHLREEINEVIMLQIDNLRNEMNQRCDLIMAQMREEVHQSNGYVMQEIDGLRRQIRQLRLERLPSRSGSMLVRRLSV